MLDFVEISFVASERKNYFIGKILQQCCGVIAALLLLWRLRIRLFGGIDKWVYLLPCLLVAVNNFQFSDYFNGKMELFNVEWVDFVLFGGYCLSVGLFEEFVFRGVLFALFATYFSNDKKGLRLTYLSSCVVFGLSHFLNGFSGATCLQVGYSVLTGGLFAFCLLKTKNLLCCGIIHGVYNFCGLLFDENGLGTGVVFDTGTIWSMFIVGVAVGVFVLYKVWKYSDNEREELYYRLGLVENSTRNKMMDTEDKKMKCIFMYNPVGGKGQIAKQVEYIVGELKEKFEEVDVYATKCAGDMSREAREIADKYDVIVFAGGDGSVNEMVQVVAEMEDPPILGYIPSGTVNDFAHTLKIPKKIKKALRIIKTGTVEQIDCMKLNDRYAIYVVTTGAFTSATYNTSQTKKNHSGRIAYYFEAIKHNLKFQPFEVDCKGQAEEIHTDGCILISFINSKYVAGFGMNKHGDLQDGKMEVAIVERKKKANFFRVIGSYFAIAGLFLFGYRAKNKHVKRLSGNAFDVDIGDDVVWNVDGEKGISGKIHIEIVPKKVKIIVPAEKKKKEKKK